MVKQLYRAPHSLGHFIPTTLTYSRCRHNSNVIATTEYAVADNGNNHGVNNQQKHHHHCEHTEVHHSKNLLFLIHCANFKAYWNYPHFSLLENNDGDNSNHEEHQSFVVLTDMILSTFGWSCYVLMIDCRAM